ncbi:hypothetical protein ACEPPN_012387 [Leptodophora sp. 'Broadleaf-Isolate-01']
MNGKSQPMRKYSSVLSRGYGVPPTYAKNSPEREGITKALQDLQSKLPVRIPLKIGSQETPKSEILTQINPSRHGEVIAQWSPATATDVKNAISFALAAKSSFNVQCAMEMFKTQPAVNPPGMWNRLEYRPLEGFVYSISPFNFTALAATLAYGPLLMGNVVVWKPSLSALHSSWLLHQILLEAGLPNDVVQFVPGDAEKVTKAVLESSGFAALNFTGSTAVFKSLIAKIGVATGEDRFLNYPRIVGETGGMNFHLIHSSADIENVVNSTIRGAFEFQGQKCSATSRVYVPESIWPEFKDDLLKKTESISVGPPEQFENFLNPVIHEQAFDRLASFIEVAKKDPKLTLLAGGKADKSVGYYIYPTIYQTSDPQHEIMKEELFGPLFAIYVYPDSEWANIPKLIDTTTRYALTGSIFARDVEAIAFAEKELRHSAGNFYINTKSSGSVVGQQPFGGMRGSGTNDKVGSVNVLSRFVSVRAIKEDFEGTKDFRYPSNEV